jgi:TIR domain
LDEHGRAVQIFLSYRRGDVGGYAGRLADALLQRLGAKSVFQDVTTIAPGQDFTAVLDRALDDCDAVLVVIGPGWLGASTPQGAPRLFEDGDYVRLELARALRRDVRIVPVLVGGASLPAATELPDELRELAQRQSVVLHDETWHQDVEGLLRGLRGEPAVTTRRNRRWMVAGAVAAALVAVGAGAWWLGPGSSAGSGTGAGSGSAAQGGSASGPVACAPTTGQGWNPIALDKNPTGEEKVAGGSLTHRVKDAHWRAHQGTWQVTLATSLENGTPETISVGDWRYKALVVAQRPFKVTCFSPSSDTVGPGLIGDMLIGFEVTCKPVGYLELLVEDDKARISVTPDTLEPGAC